MRVALVHMRHASIGGTELILEKLSAELAARGHEVTIVCRSHVEPAHPAIRFAVLRSPVIGSAWRMWAFAKAVERHVRESSYDLVLGLGKTWTHDVVRTGGGSHATYMERMRAVDGGRLRRSFKDSLALRIEGRAFAPGAYRRVIANSNLVREDMCRRHAIPPERVEVIYNGVDLERFHPRLKSHATALRKELGAEPLDFVYLFLGKGFARKGLGRLLDAFVSLAKQDPRAQLWIAGRDSSQPRYEARAQALGLA
ncbi:MAG: glycosyltransferase family 4 protein, partial [Planctomycetota bacterium]